VFAFFVGALDLGWSRGLVGAVVSPEGILLLATAGLLLAWRAVAAARAPGPAGARVARVLLSAGGALFLLGVPASFATRDTVGLAVGEGEPVAPGRLAGLPTIRFGEVRVEPRGPGILSKTVSIAARADGHAPVEIGLFPPASLGGWRLSVVTYGYGLGVTWRDDEGAPAVRRVVKLGTLPQREEDAALVQWTPDPNVMMGAGTFPPKLEDLLTPAGTDRHLFLRIEEATIAGARRDLRNPEAYRWLADGPLESAVVFAQAFRGKEKVWEGRVAAGESARWDGGELALEPRVLLWVDLLAVRDPFLAWAGAGLVLLAAGLLLRAGLAVRTVAQRARFRASGS
jgi:hypothetical protein